MPIIRKADAQWKGDGKTGKGILNTQSGALQKTAYGFSSRFEDAAGTNPEELIAAAHSGCFSMKLAFNLQDAGFIAEDIHTDCEIVFDNGAVIASNLSVKAKVEGISEERFLELVKDAELNCPISKLLSTKISVKAELTV